MEVFTKYNMLDKDIDPPDDEWDIPIEKPVSDNWVEDLFNESIEIALFNYECQVYNELERRTLT